MAPARAKRGRGLEFLQHHDSWHGLASIQSWARSWLAPMEKGGRDTPKPAASRAIRHLADGAASHSQRRQGRRGCAARLQLVAQRHGLGWRAGQWGGLGGGGRAGHWPPTRSGLADLERPPEPIPLLPILHFFSLSSLSSVCLPLIPYYPLPTTHTRCEGPIDHLPTTRLDVAAVKWSNPSIQPRLADPTTDTDSPPATAKPPTLD